MDDMNIFVPITKIDAAQRLVYGVVTAETPDVSGEVCDYASTKPLYQKWSQKFASATDGKSFGNLRAMHSNVAAGKLVEIAFNDEQKRIEICGKVVDDAEWAKVEEGVYTGFSQGGRYLKRWPDPDEPALMRYTAEPMEVSLVDHPCLPEATFAVIKADGSTELRKFKDNCFRAYSAGAAPTALGKIGARHSKADKERIKQTHDLLVGLDPDCCAAARACRRRQCRAAAAILAAGRRGRGRCVPMTMTTEKARQGASTSASLAKAIAGLTSHVDELGRAREEDRGAAAAARHHLGARRREERGRDLSRKPEALLDQPGALEALADAAIRKAQSAADARHSGFSPATETRPALRSSLAASGGSRALNPIPPARQRISDSGL